MFSLHVIKHPANIEIIKKSVLRKFESKKKYRVIRGRKFSRGDMGWGNEGGDSLFSVIDYSCDFYTEQGTAQTRSVHRTTRLVITRSE